MELVQTLCVSRACGGSAVFLREPCCSRQPSSLHLLSVYRLWTWDVFKSVGGVRELSWKVDVPLQPPWIMRSSAMRVCTCCAVLTFVNDHFRPVDGHAPFFAVRVEQACLTDPVGKVEEAWIQVSA